MLGQLTMYARTDTGPRSANEDHVLVARFVKNSGAIEISISRSDDFVAYYGLLLAVADGIGGSAGGAAASRIALTTLDREFYANHDGIPTLDACVAAIKTAGERANEAVLAAAKTTDRAGMGCTLSGICLTTAGYVVFSVGDSRVYRVRHGALRQLTVDDTLVEKMMHAGLISAEQARTSDVRHTITRCVGSSEFELKVAPGDELEDNDLLLICSDGLHDSLPHEAMKAIVTSGQPLPLLVDRLFESALAEGGQDNISAIVLRFCRQHAMLPGDPPGDLETAPADIASVGEAAVGRSLVIDDGGQS